jgi:hypothetical protein
VAAAEAVPSARSLGLLVPLACGVATLDSERCMLALLVIEEGPSDTTAAYTACVRQTYGGQRSPNGGNGGWAGTQ